MKTTVVNKHHKVPYDIYIGRGSIWGNPFSHMNQEKATKATYMVPTRDIAVDSYREWIMQQPHLLEQLHTLKGKTLACYCKPSRCHGDILVELADNLEHMSYVHVVKADLLKSDCTVIAHQANCQSTMNSGIAKQIRTMYPEAYQVDKALKMTPTQRLGGCSRSYVANKQKIVVNLYGQLRYGRDSDVVYTYYDALQKAIEEMLVGLKLNRDNIPFNIKIGMPYGIGCGLANGNWDNVLQIIEYLAHKHKTHIYLYKLEE